MENSKNLKIHPSLRPLYDYLKSNKRIIDIDNYDPEVLQIFSRDILEMIRCGEQGWEKALPAYVDNIIRDKRLFGYLPEKTTVD